jgi:hypothetical protein
MDMRANVINEVGTNLGTTNPQWPEFTWNGANRIRSNMVMKFPMSFGMSIHEYIQFGPVVKAYTGLGVLVPLDVLPSPVQWR